MDDSLFVKRFTIPSAFHDYPARFVSTSWGRSFQCNPNQCGLCCLTQKPDSVPEIHHKEIGKAICGFYDVEGKICRKYRERPSGCKTYPFFFGVEDEQIVVSLSLECPGCGLDNEIDVDTLHSIFREDYFQKRIVLLDDCYTKAILNADLWGNADLLWGSLTSKVAEFFAGNTHFPILPDLMPCILKEDSDASNHAIPRIGLPSAYEMFNNTQGLYIATRFEKFNPCLVVTKGTKINILEFDDKANVARRVKIHSPKILSLELTSGARQILRDYEVLLSNRPFLSLATVKALMENEPVPRCLIALFAGAFIPLEAGASIVAYRDNLRVIDREAMREIISFAEGTTQSTFNRPDKVHTSSLT